MRRLLAPAFLTTVALTSGCTKKPIDDGNTHNPPPQVDPPDADDSRHRTYNPPAIRDSAPPPDVTASATAEKPTPDKPTKKRKRTAAAKMGGDNSGPRPSTLKKVNPDDKNGRMIQAMSDDRCVVQVPFKGPMPTDMPTGFSPRSYENVDCPAEMDDPAYDDCTTMISVDPNSLTCYCMPDGGNPPPPPRKTKCPANAKDIAKKG